MMEYLPTLVGYMLFLLAVFHALLDGRANRMQRMLLLLTLLVFGTLLEGQGVRSGLYYYPPEQFINLGVVPLSVSLAWVGIIYSVFAITERLRLRSGMRILAATLIALSLDWGMDPVATHFGIWVWRETGAYFGIPSFNMVGWFFIPIGYLVAYGLAWDRRKGRLRLLTISEVDRDFSWQRRLYTVVFTVPLALALTGAGAWMLVALVPGLLKLSLCIMVAWAVLTVASASVLILLRRDFLRRKSWLDLVPATILAWIAANYSFYALAGGLWTLFRVMILSAIPLWIILVMTLLPEKK
ncbi:MAG: carotenoid biosynthesis protein [Deltaproteobacteria bacterium]|nr:carotenoid biosynthesis protein [Deltaproteobacteria bacterium]